MSLPRRKAEMEPCQNLYWISRPRPRNNSHVFTISHTESCSPEASYDEKNFRRVSIHVYFQVLVPTRPLTSFSGRATPIIHSTTTYQQPQLFSGRRDFSSNPKLFKGKGSKTKKAKARQAEEEDDEDGDEAEASADDPFDFTTLDQGIEKALEKLKNDLSKLRTGGRFNPEVLENLRVHLNKDSKQSERLGDLAQVLPKGGRSLMILVGEKDVGFHIHGISHHY
jgi:hypothetical protein